MQEKLQETAKEAGPLSGACHSPGRESISRQVVCHQEMLLEAAPITHLPKRARLKTDSLPFRKMLLLGPGPEKGENNFIAISNVCLLRVDVDRKSNKR